MATNSYATETWKTIPGFEDYAVSDRGQIKRIRDAKTAKAGRVLNQSTALPYNTVVLRRSGESVTQYVHRLVAVAFIGNPPEEGFQVAHYDGDRRNNHVANLRWASPLANSADKKRHGTDQVGEKHHMRKISEAQAREIIARRKAGEPHKDIAKDYGLHPAYTCLITTGKRWGHLQ